MDDISMIIYLLNFLIIISRANRYSNHLVLDDISFDAVDPSKKERFRIIFHFSIVT